MVVPISGLDVLALLLVGTVVGVFFALVLGAQGGDGRRWWRSRFGVGWPTLLFLYGLLVVGLWLPIALGPRAPGRGNLAFFLGGLAFVGGCLPVARAAGNLRAWLLLSWTSTTRAVDATPARLAVEGTVAATGTGDGGSGGTVEAPLSGTRAVAYRLKVDAVPADGTERERRRNRRTVANVERTRRFAVRDGTGAVDVDPTTAQLRIPGDGEREVAPEEDVPASLSAFLDREGVDRTGSVLRCEEATLEPGEDVFVHGRASRRGPEVVVDGGREFLVVPGSREDAVRSVRTVVLWGGGAGAVVAALGMLAMAVETGAV